MKKQALFRAAFLREGVYPERIDRDAVLPVWAALLLWAVVYVIVLLLRAFLHTVFSAAALWVSGGDVEALDRILGDAALDYPLLFLLCALPLIAVPLFYAKRRGLSPSVMGLSRPGKDGIKKALSGFLLGLLLLSLVQFGILLFPETRFSYLGFSGGRFFRLLFSVLALGAGCFGEELVFRGFLLSELCPRIRLLPALLVQALLSALVHLGNPYVTVYGLVNAFLFGLAAGCLASLSGSLLLPFAFHFGWNLAAMHLFGARLSGLSPYGGSLFSTGALAETGFLHGGYYGAEGSLPCLAALLLLLLCLLILMLRREASA